MAITEKAKDSEPTTKEEATYLKKIKWLNDPGDSDQNEEIAGKTNKSGSNNK